MNITDFQTQTAPARKPLSAAHLAAVGMSAALLAVISQISLPTPTGMPVTIQVFGIALIGSVLGWKLGAVSAAVYILIGAAGLPVFANFRGGIGSLVELTGGYIWTWPAMAALCGIKPLSKNRRWNSILSVVFALAGLAVNETAGMLQWYLLAGGKSLQSIFVYAMTVFIPKDIVLTVLAVLTGSHIRKALIRAGLFKN